MTEIQEKIYNDYLRALGKVNDRPYKPRKDFTKLDEETQRYLYRLELFFNQFKHLEPYQFFLASLEYKEVKFLPLGDYLKHSAVENNNKWGTLYNYVWPNSTIAGSYENEVQIMKNWLEARFQWLNAQYSAM